MFIFFFIFTPQKAYIHTFITCKLDLFISCPRCLRTHVWAPLHCRKDSFCIVMMWQRLCLTLSFIRKAHFAINDGSIVGFFFPDRSTFWCTLSQQTSKLLHIYGILFLCNIFCFLMSFFSLALITNPSRESY